MTGVAARKNTARMNGHALNVLVHRFALLFKNLPHDKRESESRLNVCESLRQ